MKLLNKTLDLNSMLEKLKFSRFYQLVKLRRPQNQRKSGMKKNSNQKVKSLSKKITSILIVGILCTALCISLFTAVLMSASARNVAEQAANASYDVIKSQFDSVSTTLQTDANVLALDSSVISALQGENNEDTVLIFSKEANTLGVDSATLFDADGKVRTATYSLIGTDLSSQACVKSVLNGKGGEVTMEKSDQFQCSINATVPIYVDGNLLGGILVSYDVSNTAFLDQFKKQTGNDFMIFLGDKNMNTTLMDQNLKRTTGGKLDSQIAKTVLKGGKTYTTNTKINGVKYIATYSPITSSDKTITGVLFSGYNMESYYSGLYRSVTLSMITAVTLTLLISIFSSYYLKEHIRKPLQNVVLAVNDIASGEMTDATNEALAQLTTQDEIGQLARSMEEAVRSVRKISDDTQYLEKAMSRNDLTVSVKTDSHRGIYKMIVDVVNHLFQEIADNMKTIRVISEEINNHTNQMAEASQTLAQGSTEQAGSVEELASTIESIVTKVNHTAENAKSAYRASQETETQVMSSSDQMASMMNAMEEITKTSEKIGAIVKTIDDLAFQTNLLALNAAVEAARAGAQGRGFAVVADEVRELANKSAEAAKSTEELIEDALDAIQKGTKFAHSAKEGMENVVGKTTKVNEMISQITAAADDEVQMLGQVSDGVDQISVVVQTNSSIAEETAATSQGLSAQTKQLSDMVSKYKFN